MILHHSTKIVAESQKEVTSVRKKFLKTDYSIKFIHSVINEFRNEYEKIVMKYHKLFKEEKRIVMVEILYCEENEIKTKNFLKK